MNDLEKYYHSAVGRPISKWMHYFAIYDRHMAQYRHRPIRLLEIGIDKGGSLQMWKDYFGPDAIIVGVDIETACKEFAEKQITIEIGDQADPAFWASFKQKHPPFDIILDDGGHTMRQQITTLNCLFDHVADGGIFVIEDLCTSYWLGYGGGLGRKSSLIEYSKGLVDKLNADFLLCDELEPDDFTDTLAGMHYYPGMLVLDKAKGDGARPVPCRRETDPDNPAQVIETKCDDFRDNESSNVFDAPSWRLFVWKLKKTIYTLLGQDDKAYLYGAQIRMRQLGRKTVSRQT